MILNKLLAGVARSGRPAARRADLRGRPPTSALLYHACSALIKHIFQRTYNHNCIPNNLTKVANFGNAKLVNF